MAEQPNDSAHCIYCGGTLTNIQPINSVGPGKWSHWPNCPSSVPISPPSPAETPGRFISANDADAADLRQAAGIVGRCGLADRLINLAFRLEGPPTETQTATPDKFHGTPTRAFVNDLLIGGSWRRQRLGELRASLGDGVKVEDVVSGLLDCIDRLAALQFGPPRAAQPATADANLRECNATTEAGSFRCQASAGHLGAHDYVYVTSPPSPSRDQTPSLPPARKRSYVRAVQYALDELEARLPADTNGMADLRCLRDWLAALPSPTTPSAPEPR